MIIIVVYYIYILTSKRSKFSKVAFSGLFFVFKKNVRWFNLPNFRSKIGPYYRNLCSKQTNFKHKYIYYTSSTTTKFFFLIIIISHMCLYFILFL